VLSRSRHTPAGRHVPQAGAPREKACNHVFAGSCGDCGGGNAVPRIVTRPNGSRGLAGYGDDSTICDRRGSRARGDTGVPSPSAHRRFLTFQSGSATPPARPISHVAGGRSHTLPFVDSRICGWTREAGVRPPGEGPTPPADVDPATCHTPAVLMMTGRTRRIGAALIRSIRKVHAVGTTAMFLQALLWQQPHTRSS
jgi:hypothetical protein